jgi:aspartokinase/homoserine dehydrogenase 1
VADVRHERWVYRASFENGRARIAPERLPQTHPFARLAPCENALILHSDFYRAAPLTVSGPGAGIDLTAAGVFADLVAAAQRQAVARTYQVTAPVDVAA